MVSPMLMPCLVPVVRYGDASDYVMMTASMVHDRDLLYDAGDLSRILATRPQGTDYPAGMFLVRDHVRRLHVGGHSSVYSVMAAPFYLVFGFRGFGVLNGLLLGAAIWLVSRGIVGCRLWAWVWAWAGVCFSAAFDYAIWPTAETWLLFLSAAFLWSYRTRRLWLSGALLGMGAASQAPMVMWSVLPLLDLVRGRVRPGDMARVGVAAVVMAAPQLAYNITTTGLLQPAWLDLQSRARFLYYPFAFPGQPGFDRAAHTVAYARFTRPEFLSPGDLVSALVSPRMGLLWFYPLSALAVLRMWRERAGGGALVAAAMVLGAFCTAGQLSSHQVGLRYLNPVYAALLLGFRSFKWDRSERLLLLLGLLLGITFLLFPRANSNEIVALKAVPTALLYR
jgi:hypothetical protein